jgi:hypothetical protein
MKGNQMVTANLSKVMLAIGCVMFALVMVTLAFAEDIDFTHDAETSNLRQAGVHINFGECRAHFTRLSPTHRDNILPSLASRSILIPPSLDFFAHVPKRENNSGDLFFSSSIVKETYVEDIGGQKILTRRPGVRNALVLSREYTFEQLISDIVKLSDVTSLSCSFTQINDEHIRSITNAFPGLQCLELGACPITDQAIVQISQLTNLRYLDLSDTAISGHNLKSVSELKLLSSLSLGGCSVDDHCLATVIASLPDLEMIFLHGTDSGVATLNALAAHKRLKVIDLSYTSVGDTAVAQILKMETLEELYLNETRLSVDAFRGMSSAKSLRLLSIVDVPLDSPLFRQRDGDSTVEVWQERRDCRTEADRRLQELHIPWVE